MLGYCHGAVLNLCACNQVGLEAGEHELEPALAVSLEKMSVWASHSRVCLAMVFAMAMQDLASELGGDCNASDATKVMHAESTDCPLIHI